MEKPNLYTLWKAGNWTGRWRKAQPARKHGTASTGARRLQMRTFYRPEISPRRKLRLAHPPRTTDGPGVLKVVRRPGSRFVPHRCLSQVCRVFELNALCAIHIEIAVDHLGCLVGFRRLRPLRPFDEDLHRLELRLQVEGGPRSDGH